MKLKIKIINLLSKCKAKYLQSKFCKSAQKEYKLLYKFDNNPRFRKVFMRRLRRQQSRRKRIRDRYVKKRRPSVLSVYFGVPGAGKTTMAAILTKRDLKHYSDVYSNVPITGAFRLEPKDHIGKVMIKDGRVIIDEAGLEYNNRDFKEFTKDATYFYKYHRHYNTAVDIFSQGYDDMDKKLRTLAQRLYVVKKGLLPWFIHVKRIKKRVGINDLTKEICDEYFFTKLGFRIYFTPTVWKSFNTLSRKELPHYDFSRW